MTPKTSQKPQNIEGLRKAARQKAEETRRRAEEAIALLLKEQRPINFKTVAETAQISTAWLYANEAIKTRIIHLRSKPVSKAQVKIPVREQAERIKELEKQLEVAYGSLYQQ